MLRVLALLVYAALALGAIYLDLGHYVVVGTVVLPIAVWLLGKPVYLAGAVISSYAWPYTIVSTGGFTVFKVANLLLTTVTVLKVINSRKIAPVPVWFFAALGLLLVLQLAAELFAPTGADSQATVLLISTTLLMLILTQIIRTPQDLRKLSTVFSINVIALALYVVREMSWATMELDTYARAHGPMHEPNGLCWMLLGMLGLVWATATDSQASRPQRVLALVASAGGIYSIIASSSRSGAIGLTILTLTFAGLLARTNTRRLLAVGLAGLVLVGITLVAPRSFDERVLGTVIEERRNNRRLTLGERDQHARLGAEMIAERPWLGHGSQGFFRRLEAIEGDAGRSLHSSVINIAVSFGLPSGILYALLLFGSAVAAWRIVPRWGPDRTYLVGLAATLLASAVSSLGSARLYSPNMWSMVAVAYILHRQLRGAGSAQTPIAERQAGAPSPAPRAQAYFPAPGASSLVRRTDA